MIPPAGTIDVRLHSGATRRVRLVGIDTQTDDPFYGFNLGSTHVRVGARGEPTFYQFESPLLRLMLEELGFACADHAARFEVAGDGGAVGLHELFQFDLVGRFRCCAAARFGQCSTRPPWRPASG